MALTDPIDISPDPIITQTWDEAILGQTEQVSPGSQPSTGTPVQATPAIVAVASDYRSPNFVPGLSGWELGSNGVIRAIGMIISGDISGSTGTFLGNISAATGSIGGFTIASSSLSTGAFDTLNTMYFGSSGLSLSNTFKVDNAGALTATGATITGDITATSGSFTGAVTATSGTIGGFTITSNSLYGSTIKTGATVGAGSNGVIMDTAGLRGYSIALGNTFDIPTDGSAPTFNSGIINYTTFNVDVDGIIQTSTTVGDGSSASAGIFMNDNGFFACETNQDLVDANVRILTDGSAYFSGTFNLGGTTVTIDNTQDIQTNLDTINTAGGGTLYLKSGTYTLTSAGLTMYPGVTLIGTSPSGTILDFNSTTGRIIIAGTHRYSTGTITSITSGVTVVGSGTSWAANVVAGRDHLFINGQWMVIAVVTDNTHITLAEGYDGATVGAGSAYRISSVIQNINIKELTVKNSTGSGIDVDDARFLVLNNVFSQSNNIGIDGNYATEWSLNNIITLQNTSHGITLTGGGRNNWQGVNSVVNGGSGIILNSVRSLGFSTGVANSNTGNGFNITNCTDISLTTFDASANGGQGIELVSGNTSISIIDAGVRGNASDGLKLTTTTDTTQIIGGDFKYNGGYGINITDSTCDESIISSTSFLGNTSGSINDLGTGTSSGGVRGGQTDFNTGIGYFLGLSGGQSKVSIGNPSGDYVLWDGTKLKLRGNLEVSTEGLINNSVYTVANLPVAPTYTAFLVSSAFE